MSQIPNKLTVQDLRNIQRVLRVSLLPIPDTGLNYAINKNLQALDKYLMDKEKLANNIREKYLVKDADGKAILFAYHSEIKDVNDPLFGHCKLDQDGNYIVVEEKDAPHIPNTTRYDILHPQYKEDMKEWENDVQFTFHKFNQEKVEALIKSGKFDTVDYSPIVNHLFDDIKE